jgi:hypothetical protein
VLQRATLTLGHGGKFWPVTIRHPDTQLLHATVQRLLPATRKLGQSVVRPRWTWHVSFHLVAAPLLNRLGQETADRWCRTARMDIVTLTKK